MVEGKMRQFKKAPAYVGKPLSLYVRRGNRTIGDNEVLVGDEWARFVEMGYLVEVTPAPEPVKPMVVETVVVIEPPPKPVAKVPSEPVKEEVPAPEPVAEVAEHHDHEGTVTKSPFNKPSKKGKR